MRSWRCAFCGILYASVMALLNALFSASFRPLSSTGAFQSQRVTPASCTSSRMARMAVCICSWPNITAPSITSSGSSFASDSTMSTAFSVPATTDVRINVRIHRLDGSDDLNFVDEAFGEERTDGTVNQAASQYFFLGGSAFTFEEATRYSAGGVRSLLIIDGERKPVLPRLRLLRCDYRREHDRVAHRCQHRTTRLARDLAGLQANRTVAVLKGLRDFSQRLILLRLFAQSEPFDQAAIALAVDAL